MKEDLKVKNIREVKDSKMILTVKIKRGYSNKMTMIIVQLENIPETKKLYELQIIKICGGSYS